MCLNVCNCCDSCRWFIVDIFAADDVDVVAANTKWIFILTHIHIKLPSNTRCLVSVVVVAVIVAYATIRPLAISREF